MPGSHYGKGKGYMKPSKAKGKPAVRKPRVVRRP